MSSYTLAEIIAVGSELLTPSRVDTNSLFLTERLNAMGVEVAMKSIVGDERARLAEVVTAALRRASIVILTGGLGPTEDDVTRDAVATALGVGQRFDEQIAAGIEQRFQRMGRPMAEINKRQAFLLEGAQELPNPNGTAPGQWIQGTGEWTGRTVLLLPGPPREMKPMFQEQCEPRLLALLPPQAIGIRHYRVAGMGESDLDQLIAPVYTRYQNPITTVLAAAGDIQVILRSRAAQMEEAETLVEEVGSQIEPLLGDRLYSRDGSDLESTVVRLLLEKKETLSVAESLTGGLVGQRLTSVPGSGTTFLGGFLVYTDEMKANLLGVSHEVLRVHTAVSEAAAEEMALGARERTGATYAVSLTGYAGPDGGTEAHPVGTVFIGVAKGRACRVHHFRFMGDRFRNRVLAAQTALDLLRRRLLS